MFTGQPPFRGETAMDVLVQPYAGDLSDTFARLDACGAEAELVRLAKDCLAARPACRPADGSAVAARVTEYLAGVQERLRCAEIGQARAEARAEGERKRRRLAVALTAVMLLLLLAGGSAAWLVQQQRASQREADNKALAMLARGRSLLEEGWRANDLARINEAKAEADAARRAAASAAVEQQVAAFGQEVEQRLERTRKNGTLLLALLDVAFPGETSPGDTVDPGGMMVLEMAQPSMEEQYAAAFRSWGVDVDAGSETEVLARLRDEPEPVLDEVIAGLDLWMLHRRSKKGPWRRLFRLAGQLDRSARRRQLRKILVHDAPLRAHEVAGLVSALGSAARPWLALAELERVKQWRLHLFRDQMNPQTEPVPSVILLAEVCRRAGGAAVAEELLRRALAARPDQVGLLFALGHLLQKQGTSRLAEAIEQYRAIRAREPRLGITLGMALIRAGRAWEGEEVLRDLVRRQPNNAVMHLYLGHALQAQKKEDQIGTALAGAEAVCRQAIRVNPKYARAYIALGILVSMRNRPVEGEALLRQAVALNPNSSQAQHNLGLSLARQRKLDEAVAAYRKALDLQPDHLAQTYHHLSVALLWQKKPAEAEPPCRKAIQLDPEYAEAHCHLGMILRARGEFEECLAAMRRGHELGLKRPHWRHPSAGWVRTAERLVELARKLPSVLRGEWQPASAFEQVEVATLCRGRSRYMAAARLYRAAFAADARLVQRPPTRVRYDAACTAVLAAGRQGEDTAGLDNREIDQWRQQALDWLRADLNWWSSVLPTLRSQGRTVMVQHMRLWLCDPDLAGVRDRSALARLPRPQREQWLNLWADVRGLLARASVP
jgi:serine/threonine-protein kinase